MKNVWHSAATVGELLMDQPYSGAVAVSRFPLIDDWAEGGFKLAGRSGDGPPKERSKWV